jgi:hypothetical protein
MYSASLVLCEQPKVLTHTLCVPGTAPPHCSAPTESFRASLLLAGPAGRAALATTGGSEWMMRAPSTGSDAR